MTVVPGQKGTAGLEEVPDPGMQDGALLVRGMAVGICGTDREIAEVGTVNAGRRHWEQAAEALAVADPSWLSGMITRRVPLTSWTESLDRHPEDIKVVVDLTR
jgi:threonine dehydrogenase-like Zn-dependent dehydrogenase